jgi:hypothetical protein
MVRIARDTEASTRRPVSSEPTCECPRPDPEFTSLWPARVPEPWCVYDIARTLDRVTEDQLGLSLPSDEHGLSKYAIAQCLDLAHRSGAVDAVELRLFDLPITLRQNRTFSYLYLERDRRCGTRLSATVS